MTSEQLTQILIGILACVWIGDFIRGVFQKKKTGSEANLNDANAVQVIVGSAATVVAPLKERVEELQQDLTEAKGEVERLITQLQAATAENQRITVENTRIIAENRQIVIENRRLRLALGRGL